MIKVLRRPVESADAAGIRVMRQPGEVAGALASAGPERHFEAVQHERGGHARRGTPAEDAAGVRVEHKRDVNPSGPRPDIREVSDPELVGAEPREVPVDEVGRSGLSRIRIDGPLPLPTDHADDSQLAHEAFDRAAGDVVPVTAKPQPELAGAEDPPLLLPGRQNDRLPPLIRHLPCRRPSSAGVVVGRWGDLHVVLGEHVADRLDTPPESTIAAVLVLLNERH